MWLRSRNSLRFHFNWYIFYFFILFLRSSTEHKTKMLWECEKSKICKLMYVESHDYSTIASMKPTSKAMVECQYCDLWLFCWGLQRGYSEDAVEADEMMMKPESPQNKMKHKPSRPPRKGSLSRSPTGGGYDNQMNGTLEPGNTGWCYDEKVRDPTIWP